TAGGTLVLETDGAITLQNSGTLTTSSRGNSAAGEIFIHNLATTNGAITLGKNVTTVGAGAGGVAGALSHGGVVTVLNDSGNVLVNAPIDVSKQGGGASDGTIQLQASGSITGAGVLSGDTNGSLLTKTTGTSGTANISLTGGGTNAATTSNAIANAAFS